LAASTGATVDEQTPHIQLTLGCWSERDRPSNISAVTHQPGRHALPLVSPRRLISSSTTPQATQRHTSTQQRTTSPRSSCSAACSGLKWLP